MSYSHRLVGRLGPVALALSVTVPLAGCGAFFPSSDTGAGAPTGNGGKPWELHPIRLDTVGFLPDRAKRATVIAPGGTMYEIHKVADDAVVSSGPLDGPMTDAGSGTDIWIADFTAFSTEGDYYLAVPGLGQSAPFHVGATTFNDALVRSMLGLYGQRCGQAVDITLGSVKWNHKTCHTKDASTKYLNGQDVIKPSLGGWHDAGDYGKYITNGAFTVGMLLAAWEHFQPTLSKLSLPIPEHGGAIPDYLAEVKVELDWLFSTQSEDGGVSHKVTALNFEGFVAPDQDGQRRYYTGVGTSATGDFVAVMAAAGRIYAPYDAAFAAKCLAAARVSYAYLQSHGYAFPDDSAFSTGGYGDGDDTDERMWAAAEMWETTGEAPALADFETRATGAKVAGNFDWGNVGNLGLFTYLMSKREGRSATVLAALTKSATDSADGIVATSSVNGYGRGIGNYWWGSNGAVARTAMNLWVANTLAPAPKYLDGIVAQVDHLLGRNIYDRSQVTAIGYHPPLKPHHRPSSADNVGDPWPGLLVGGQESNDTPNWKDSQDAYNVNEIAINWTGAMVYATAALAR